MSYPRVPCTHLTLLAIAVVFAGSLFGCGGENGDPFDNQNIDINDVGEYDVGDVGDAGDVGDTDPSDVPDAELPDSDVPDADNDVDPPPDPDDIIECDEPLAQPPEGQRCTVEPGTSDNLVFQGTLLVGDEIYEAGTLVVDDQAPNRRIECAGCDCADDPVVDEATVVSCPDAVISPGLINPHDHLTFAQGRPQPHGDDRYDHRHDWRTGARGHDAIDNYPTGGNPRAVTMYGELRMLFGGATSIAGSTAAVDATGLLRNLDQPHETEGLDSIAVEYSTFPLGDADGTLLAEGCAYSNFDDEVDDGIYLPHVAEGIDDEARNELRCMSGQSGHNLIEDNTSIIHGIATNARDVAMIADRGANLVWSPRTNIDLYGNTAPVPLYQHFGVPISLGTDWSTSGSMNMLRELECADYLNRNHFNDTFTEAELWKMATYNGAITMGAEHKLGLLYPDYVADITIFDDRGRSPYRAVIDADIDEIALVLRGGEPLYGDAELVEQLVSATDVDQCELVDVCERDRRACVELDIGESIDDIKGQIPDDSYPLFFCEEPEDEPTCVPARPSEYDGITGSDSSGDGIQDSVDNCPEYFNPIRPMDDGLQSDINGTGMGDVCDPCPLSEDTDCTELDPDDWAGDGVPNDEDNCPYHYNPDQTDTSGDGVGDACSPCPNDVITPGQPCPSTIYDIKTGDVDEGTALELRNALVTGVHPGEGLFVQVHPDDDEYDGIDDSGLYIYLRHVLDEDEFPEIGDRIRVTGSVSVFFSQIQLADVTHLEITSSDHDLPPSETVGTDEIAAGGDRQWALEGTLVEVQDLTVVDNDPGPGAGEDESIGEFVVDDSLYVNNFFHTIDPFPDVGDTYESITGVLRWANGRSRVEPRSEADIYEGPPQLEHFDPDVVFAQVSDSADPLLELYLDRPADDPIDVELTSSDPGVVEVDDQINFAPGDESTSVEIHAVSVADDPVVVEATHDEVTVSAEIQTYDEDTERELIAFETDRKGYFSDQTLTVSAELDVPAGAGGETVDLDISPDFDAGLGDELTIDSGEQSNSVEVDLDTDLVGRYVAVATHADTTKAVGFEVFEASEVFIETFANFETSGNQYFDGSFAGDLGFDWDYTNAREASGSASPTPIDATSMTFQTSDGSVGADDIDGDISTFAVDMKKAFTGAGDRQLELLIDDEVVATSSAFDEEDVVHEFVVEDIDTDSADSFDLELRSTQDNQITVDNLRWSDGPHLDIDPDDVEFAPVKLDAFVPEFAFLETADDPEPILTLHSQKPALEPTTVDLSYDSGAVIGPDEVTFPTGESAVEISLEATQSTTEPVEVSAIFDGDIVTADVHPYDDDTDRTITAFDACSSALVDHPVEFFVEIDIPAPEDGLSLPLTIDPESAASSAPDHIDIDAGQRTEDVQWNFDEPHSSIDLTVATDDDEATHVVSTVDIDPPLTEHFDDLDPDDNFGDGDFTGNHGLFWSYQTARGTDDDAIDDISLVFDSGGTRSLTLTDPPSGVESFQVDVRLAEDADEDGQLELRIDDQTVATSDLLEVPSSGDPEVQTFTVDNIGASCADTLELQSIGDGELVIDDLEWNPAAP